MTDKCQIDDGNSGRTHNINIEKQKNEINHHKQRSSFKLRVQKKTAKFQQELGVGTQSYMHRYRTGSLQIVSTDYNEMIVKNESIEMVNIDNNIPHILSNFNISSIYLPTIPKHQQHDKNRQLNQDKQQRQNLLCSRSRSKQFEVDYKKTGKENFYTSLDRMKAFMSLEKEMDITKDMRDIGSISAGDGDHAILKQLVDDLTFSGVHHGQQEKEKDITDEVTRSVHRAKEKRKKNEILARKAILIANSKPLYMDWIESKGKFIKTMNALVVSNIFETVIMFIIMVNTIILSLTWQQQNKELKDMLESINNIFTFIFILEAILKLIGLGPKAYFMDNWNKFDFIIVLVSIIEMIIDMVSQNGGHSAISALRSLRLLRTFRLLGKFDKLRRLFMLVIESMNQVSLLTIVLSIFIFMFATLAMSLFGGKLIELGDARSGRWRFDNFYWSVINVFMVISGDSWNKVMSDTVKATNNKLTVIYYIMLICFGTFIVLNLFVAILLSRMGSDKSDEEFISDGLVKYSRKMFEHHVSEQEQIDRLVMSIQRNKYIAQSKDKRSKWKQYRDKQAIQGESLGIFTADNPFRILCHDIVHWRWFEISIDILILINCVILALESPQQRKKYATIFFIADIFFTVIFVLEFLLKVIALGAFEKPFGNNMRKWNKIKNEDDLIEWTDKAYQATFFMHTLNNNILNLPGLAIECIKSNDDYCIVQFWGQQVLRIVYYENSFATCYKLIDQETGKWQIWHPNVIKPQDAELKRVLTSFDLSDKHHNAYFASNWNRLDAFVVLAAVLGVVFDNISFLIALRAFRPFRIMVRFKNIKVVLGALLRAIPGLFNSMLFCILFWFVLAILGVNWFNGLYRHCRIDDVDIYSTICSDETCNDSYVMYNFGKTECESSDGLIWHISVFNFDNVLQAIHTIFCVASLSGWNFVMYSAIDSSEFNEALIKDNRCSAAIYFVVVVILCSFFSLNLIVSVVVDNFNTIKAEKDGSAFQTEEQALWVRNQRLLQRISLDATYGIPKNIFLNIIQHDLFEPFIISCIILNALSMTLQHYEESDEWTEALKIADILFVIIFLLEAILKISGYGFKIYILSNWNKFDFIISIVGVIGLAADSSIGLNVLRIFRIGRLLRLLHKAKTLKMLFWTLIYSIPSLWNIGLLLFVIFFIYAIIGMHILTDYDHKLSSEVNTYNFWNAMYLLYRIGTEDGWTDIYISYLESWPEHQRYKIYIYFISFFVLGTLVLINLFIAVVLDSFDENHKSFDGEDKFITIQIFRDIWSYFDPSANRQIPVREFINILKLTPKTTDFYAKHKIIGPGFYDGNPFKMLYNRTNSSMRSLFGGYSYISKKLKSIYDVNDRKEKLIEICPNNIHHQDIIKLLLRLRLKVEMKDNLNYLQLTFFGKLMSYISDVCNSMNIASIKGEELIKSQTTTRIQKDDDDDIDMEHKYDMNDDFDVGDKTWFVSYDDALLAICSEVIGPRLPNGFPMFEIINKQKQLRIAEWYTIKNDCYHIFKSVNLANQQNKQYSEL